MTTATTQFAYVRTIDTHGVTYRAYTGDTFAYVALVYHTGKRWRATLTRGSYRTRHAAACAALAQRSATVPACDDDSDDETSVDWRPSADTWSLFRAIARQ